jgi:hypothetical protein
MVELAARHGFYMNGESIPASEDDEESESYHGDDRNGASAAASPAPGWADTSRRAEPGTAKKSRDHRGMAFYDMQRIFSVLVSIIGVSCCRGAPSFPLCC